MYVPTGDIKSIRKEQSGTAKDLSYKGIARHKRPSDSLEYNCYTIGVGRRSILFLSRNRKCVRDRLDVNIF